jgi:hypothetical protein
LDETALRKSRGIYGWKVLKRGRMNKQVDKWIYVFVVSQLNTSQLSFTFCGRMNLTNSTFLSVFFQSNNSVRINRNLNLMVLNLTGKNLVYRCWNFVNKFSSVKLKHERSL